jgi:amino acid transporter
MQTHDGRVLHIGPEHPDYRRKLAAAAQQNVPLETWKSVALVFGFVLGGAAGIWWNWHEVAAEGHFYVKLSVIAPLCLVFGLFMGYGMISGYRSQAGQQQASRVQYIVAIVLTVIALTACCLNPYLLYHYRP